MKIDIDYFVPLSKKPKVTVQFKSKFNVGDQSFKM